ncbi:DUF2958 domain-containing protein [Hyphomicrobium sp.]|jgi:hypothetical protein|uniref:DUF2958 domain-containing protein n=1 Tax=Hyphomicrobium sp. TaxID=82 RepID=UPI0035620CDB
MILITKEQLQQLADNGRRQAAVKGTDAELDLQPVVKIFNPTGAGTWLLTEIDPDDTDIAWGLCDLGFGCPEFGTVRISELRTVGGRFGLPLERDRHWQATAPISAYIEAADAAGHIVDHVKPSAKKGEDEAGRA